MKERFKLWIKLWRCKVGLLLFKMVMYLTPREVVEEIIVQFFVMEILINGEAIYVNQAKEVIQAKGLFQHMLLLKYNKKKE